MPGDWNGDWDTVRGQWNSVHDDVERGRPSHDERAARGWLRLGRSTPVLFTGVAGSGKTMLNNALMRPNRIDAADSSRSKDIEKQRTVFGSGRKRIQASVVVIPGQMYSPERGSGLAATLTGKASPTGIIHVVCWGHNRIWSPGSETDIGDALRSEDPSFNPDSELARERMREFHLVSELAEFREICGLIEDGAAKRLSWMIVAVCQCDLYWNRIEQARDYYIPRETRTDNQFCKRLRDLTKERTSIRIAVLPMSSRRISYRPLREMPMQRPTLDDVQIGILRNRFSSTLRDFLG